MCDLPQRDVLNIYMHEPNRDEANITNVYRFQIEMLAAAAAALRATANLAAQQQFKCNFLQPERAASTSLYSISLHALLISSPHFGSGLIFDFPFMS